MDKKTYCTHAIQLYQGKTNQLDCNIIASNEFIDFCHEHRILSRIEKKILPYLTQKTIRDYFVARLTTCRMQSLKQAAAIMTIAKLFNENNISWLSFKGPMLSHVLFSNVAWRTSKDVDIWVCRHDFSKVCQLLQNHGFQQVNTHSISRFKKIQQYITNKDFTFWNASLKIYVELHWRLFVTFDLNEHMILKNIRHITFSHERIPVFNLEMEFIYLSMHAYATAASAKRLCWLFDLYDYSQMPNFDSMKCMSLARQYCLDRSLVNGIYILNYFFDLAIDCDEGKYAIIKPISQRKIRIISCGIPLVHEEFSFVMLRHVIDESVLSRSLISLLIGLCVFFGRRIRELFYSSLK